MADLEELMALGMSWELAAKVMAVSGGSKPTLASMGLPAAWTTNPAGTAATFFDSPGGPILQSLDQGADNINSIVKPAPTPPYFLAVKVVATMLWDTPGNSWGGLVFRDSTTGKLIPCGILADPTGATWVAVWAINFSDPSTYGGSATLNQVLRSADSWIGVADDGTNISYWRSQDGVSYMRMFRSTRAAGYLGATGYKQVGIFCSGHASQVSVSFPGFVQKAAAPGNVLLYTP